MTNQSLEVPRANRLRPAEPPRTSHVQQCLDGALPVVAATDHVRAVRQLIAEYLNVASYTTLGTDGFGRSDTRVALRAFFEVDRFHIALAALDRLVRCGAVDADLVTRAITRYAIEPHTHAPWSV